MASLHKYTYAHGNPVMNLDPSGNGSLTELMVAVGIATMINNIATTVIATYLTAESWKNMDDDSARAGIVITVRGTATGYGVVGEGGGDLLWLPKEGAGGVYAYWGGDVGTNPISFWRKHRGFGRSVSVGVVLGIDSAQDWSGFSSTATWPAPALAWSVPIFRRIMSKSSGIVGMLERLAYFNNRSKLHGVIQVGFSTSGPGFLRWGFASNAFTWDGGWLSQPYNVGDGVSSLFSGLSIEGVMDNPTLLYDRMAALSQ